MTTKSKHTPGPWSIAEGWRISPKDLPVIGITSGSLKGDDGKGIAWIACHGLDAEQNARLIATSPDLFEFVKEIADEPCYEQPGEFPEPGESGIAPCRSCQARALIAKTEPEPRKAEKVPPCGLRHCKCGKTKAHKPSEKDLENAREIGQAQREARRRDGAGE